MNCKHYAIKNKACLAFNIAGKNHCIESNEVVAHKVTLRIIKEQNQNVVYAGDKIRYKVTICNDSCIDLFDLDFKDTLDFGTKYEWNSFKVNGDTKFVEIVGRNLCYHVHKLCANETMVFTFEAEVE